MKIRIGAFEFEVDTREQLEELVMRYGGAAVVVSDTPAPRATARGASASPTSGARADGATTDRAD